MALRLYFDCPPIALLWPSYGPPMALQLRSQVGSAFITLLQAITFDDWTVIMYALMRSTSTWAWVYFVAIVVLGGFFVVNLFLAVVFEQFIWTQSTEAEPTVVERRQLVDNVLGGLEFYQAP